jgi:hypothetical protein
MYIPQNQLHHPVSSGDAFSIHRLGVQCSMCNAMQSKERMKERKKERMNE